MQYQRFWIDRRSPAAWVAMLLMVAAAVIRLIYYPAGPMSPVIFWVYLVNTVAASAIFLGAVLLFGERMPQLTVLPVLMGVVFFIVKAFSFPSLLHTWLCVTLYLGVLVLYTLTIFGVIRTKYLLYPLFGLPLLYHIFVEDMQLYVFADPPVAFFEWLPELSVLCIMGALLCISVAIKPRSV